MLFNRYSKFYLTDIFDISYGNKFDLYALEETNSKDTNGVAFVTRTANNNGVGAFVKRKQIQPYHKNSITVALGGSLGATFIQPEPFYTSQNVAVLCDKHPLTLNQKLFIATLIKKEASIRYIAFGRELNKHIKKDFSILLPVTDEGAPDWEWIEQYMRDISPSVPVSKNNSIKSSLNSSGWSNFKIGELFRLEIGKNKSQENLPEGDSCLYIGAKKSQNGVMLRCGYDSDLMSDGNCIVFICNGQGSVGYCNYMDRPFIGTSDLVMGYNPNLNKYIGLFLVTVIDLQRPKFSFGRKWKIHLKETIIKLPAIEEGSPDWHYMEEYIKSQPYGDCL